MSSGTHAEPDEKARSNCVRAHDVNPRAYLHLVTRLIVRGWPQSKLAELLPDALRRAHPEIALLPAEDDELLLTG